MSKKNRPQSRKQNLVEQEVDGELLIYDIEKNKAYCLNTTSMLVWQACDGKRTIAEINDRLGKQLKSQIEEDLVWLALDQLKKENLIDGESYLPEKFNGMNRREVVRKIGFSSLAALPVIVSLAAPVAGQAGSVCIVQPNGCNCGADGQMGVPIGSECIPAGLFAMTCADTRCRCINQGPSATPNDTCQP